MKRTIYLTYEENIVSGCYRIEISVSTTKPSISFSEVLTDLPLGDFLKQVENVIVQITGVKPSYRDIIQGTSYDGEEKFERFFGFLPVSNWRMMCESQEDANLRAEKETEEEFSKVRNAFTEIVKHKLYFCPVE